MGQSLSPLKNQHVALLPWFLGLFLVSWLVLSIFQRQPVFSATKNVTVCTTKSKIIVLPNAKKSCGKNEKKVILSSTSGSSPNLCIHIRKKSISVTATNRCGPGQIFATQFSKSDSIRSCTNKKTRQIQFLSGSRCARGLTFRSLPVRQISEASVQDPESGIASSTTVATTTTIAPTVNGTTTTTSTTSTTTTTIPVQQPSTTTSTSSTTTSTIPAITTTTVAPSSISSFTASATTINQGQSTSVTAVWSGASASINQSIGAISNGGSISISPTSTTTYTLTVSNGAGHSLTQNLTIYVNSLSIASHPQDTTTDNPFGQNLTVSASASGGLSYQWFKDSQPIANAISSSYRATQDGSYYVVVTSTLNGVTRSTTSNSATFAMNTITILTQPTGTIIGDGQTATFTVAATATGSLSYQWKVNSADVAGATLDSFTSTTYGTHQVVVTSTLNGMTTSVTSSSAWLDVNTVAITSDPSNTYLTQGGTASLGVTVSSHGSATVSYQWYLNGSEIVGANEISIQATQQGTYKVRVTSTRGGTTAVKFSNDAVVTEVPPASISSLTATPASVGFGNSTDLTSIFSGGNGILTPGNISLVSGTPVTVTPSITTEYTVTVTNLAGHQASYSIRVVVTTGYFTATSNNSSANRYYGAKAVTLQSGKVLVFGSGINFSTSTDLYNPTTNAFVQVGNMIRGRSDAAAVRLQNGKVLAIGGMYHNGTDYVSLSTVEIFDPVTETWSNTGSLNVARENPLAILLNDGRVLVAGGYRRAPASTYINSAEIYDPTTGTFTYTSSMPQARGNPTGTLMASGNVFVASGYNPTNGHMKSAIIYDVSSSSWTTISSQMNSVHSNGGATTLLLQDGRILVAGGWNAGVGVATIDIYNPATNSFVANANLPQFSFGRGGITGHVMSNGLVVFFGGSSGVGNIADTAVVYDPISNTMTTEANKMRWWRYMHTSAQLSDGRVIIIGGNSTNNSAADVYTP